MEERVRNGNEQRVSDNEEEPTWVIRRLAATYTVHDAAVPSAVYTVSFQNTEGACTCPDFKQSEHNTCPHVRAVEEHVHRPKPSSGSNGGPIGGSTNGQSTAMVLKRSVSPDGRIDSLSIELATPLDSQNSEEALGQAAAMLALQGGIAAEFLGDEAHQTQEPTHPNGQNGFVAGTLVKIAGMNTRVGWRFFINVQVGDREHKLFGSKKQLGEHLEAAGYPQYAGNIANGVELNLPCLVRLVPSDDGKYQNVQEVAPVHSGSKGG